MLQIAKIVERKSLNYLYPLMNHFVLIRSPWTYLWGTGTKKGLNSLNNFKLKEKGFYISLAEIIIKLTVIELIKKKKRLILFQGVSVSLMKDQTIFSSIFIDFFSFFRHIFFNF